MLIALNVAPHETRVEDRNAAIEDADHVILVPKTLHEDWIRLSCLLRCFPRTNSPRWIDYDNKFEQVAHSFGYLRSSPRITAFPRSTSASKSITKPAYSN